jgi:PAS domain S-box-containing protein
MKKFTILLFTLLGITLQYINGLTSCKNDTLKNFKKTLYNNDIEILNNLAEKVYLKNPEKSLQYAETALEIAKKNKDLVSEEKSLHTIGKIYKRTDYDQLAIPYFYKAIEISINQNLTQNLPLLFQDLGDVFYKLNKIDSATNYYNKSLKINLSTNNHKSIADLYIRLGNTFWYSAGYDKSLDYYLKALTLYENIKNKNGINNVYTNIGALYSELNDYKNAKIYFQKIIINNEFFSKPESLANFYYRFGKLYENTKQYDSAFYYYQAAISILDSFQLKRKTGEILNSYSSIFFEKGETENAIKYALKALDIFTQYNNEYGIALSNIKLSQYYLKQEEYPKSLNSLNTALTLAKKINSVDLLKSNYLNFSNYYKNIEQYKNALKYYTLYQQMNDTVLNREKNLRIAELQTKYETERKEKELSAKNIEINKKVELINKQKRNLYLFGIAITLILIMSFMLFRQYRLLAIKGRHIQEINIDLDKRVKEKTASLQLTQFSVDHAADPIIWLNQQGNLLFANNIACKFLEYTKEEFLTQNITNIIPKFSEKDWNDIWEIISVEGSIVLEMNFQKKSKNIFPVEIALNYINHDEKEYAFGFIRDISDRKQKEENLRNAKERAEVADKLKSAFLANMSHEIRTPMNAILGFSDLLIANDVPEEEKLEFGSIIKSSADTLLKLIDDIIDISLIDAGQLKMNYSNINLNNTLKEIVRFYQEDKLRVNKAHLNIRLNESNSNNDIFIYTDAVRFRQIITNLMGNALKFTDSGIIEVGYIHIKDTVKIYVRDTGIGIPEDKLQVIFERFSKLNEGHKLYSGTGLGLAISKKMVQQMGGDLSVASELKKGSIFWFVLPCKTYQDINNPGENTRKISFNEINWNNKTILIVEDIDSNYFYLEAILKRTKVNVKWAQDGIQAIELCKKYIPDLILMDIQLPQMDGYTVTREILSQYPSIPIIAQTAFAFTDEKEKILKAGCQDYLTKPIDAELLINTLYKYIV